MNTRPTAYRLAHRLSWTRFGVAWLLASLSLAASGCTTFRLSSPFAKSHDLTPEERPSVGDIMGPTERALQGVRWEREKKDLAQTALPTAESLKEYEAAEELYRNGQYHEAEKAFKKLAKKHRREDMSFRGRFERLLGTKSKSAIDPYVNYGDPIEEDSLFMVAECQFAQRRYSWAQDTYDELLNKYGSTRHLDIVTRRMFSIAHYWLGFPSDTLGQKETGVELAAVNVPDDPPGTEPPKRRGPSTWPIVPNFTDRTRPVFDADGRALQALRSIWLHDATGPLADDALMLSANYSLAKGDYIEAAQLYQLLREQYPDSRHYKDAYLLGGHVMMASYSGPAYEGQPLEQARDLKEATRRLFPDLSPEQKDRLDEELRKIADAQVARIWERVEFYTRKGQPTSVALYCHLIINQHPESPYAERAREKLRQVEPQLQAPPAPSVAGWFRRDGSPGNPRGVAEPPHDLTEEAPADDAAAPEDVAATDPAPAPAGNAAGPGDESAAPDAASAPAQDAPSRFGSVLRRAPRLPRLLPVNPRSRSVPDSHPQAGEQNEPAATDAPPGGSPSPEQWPDGAPPGEMPENVEPLPYSDATAPTTYSNGPPDDSPPLAELPPLPETSRKRRFGGVGNWLRPAAAPPVEETAPAADEGSGHAKL